MDLHPKVIDLTLDRVLLLLKYLGNPQLSLPPVIHIAGTNGKGSTQAMIRAGLEATGKLVHAYTSPHLAKFHERIRIAGKLITEEALTQQLDTCYEANNGQNITYFEITTCAALRAFSQVSADYTILEVGLGGRLDATNVVNKPAACIITPIDLDHQQFLGDTIAKIAYEKAGILKQGVTAIIGPQHDEAREIIEKQAAKVGATLLIHGQDWHVDVEAGNLIYQDENGRLDLPLPSLPGPHQIENAGAAIATLRFLKMNKINCTGAVTDAIWPARMERLQTGSLVDTLPHNDIWLDGGHNPAAGRAIAATLESLPKRDTHIICGMINTKEVEGFLKPISKHCKSLTALSIPDVPNAISEIELMEVGNGFGLTCFQGKNINQILKNLSELYPGSRILICGSLYLAGHVLRENKNTY